MQGDADDVAGDASRNIPVLHGNRPKGMPKTFMKSFAKKTTISWLRENYQLSEQHTTAIETMYHDYRAFSASQNLPSATRPIFGKIVRLAFPGVIKCRRGKRGSTLRHFTLTRRPSSSSQLRHPQQQASSEPQIYSNPSELSSSSAYAYSSSSSTSSQLSHPQPHPHSLPPSLPGSESTEHLWRKLLDDIRQDKKAPSSSSPPTSSSSMTTISRSYPFNPSGIKLERTSLDAGCFAEDGSDSGYGAAAGRGGSSSPSHSDSASGRSSPGPLFESGSSSIEPSALPFSTSYSNDYFRWLSLPAQEEQDSYEQPQQAHWFYGKETTNTVNERPLPAPYYRAGWPQPTPTTTTATSGDYKYSYTPSLSSSSSSLRMSSGGNAVAHCSCPQCRCSCYHCTNHLRA